MRKSLDSRMDRILDHILPVGSMERREHDLPEHLRDALDYWRRRGAAIIDRAENTEAGGAFRQMLDDELHLPRIPAVLSDALGLSDLPRITTDMGSDEIERVYRAFATGEEQ